MIYCGLCVDFEFPFPRTEEIYISIMHFVDILKVVVVMVNQGKRRVVTMCIFDIRLRGNGCLTEVSRDEAENAELAIEEAMGCILLKLFDGGIVDDVSIRFSTQPALPPDCSIQIRVRCPCQHFSLLPNTKEHMQNEMQKYTQVLLTELFPLIEMEQMKMAPASRFHGDDPAFACAHCG